LMSKGVCRCAELAHAFGQLRKILQGVQGMWRSIICYRKRCPPSLQIGCRGLRRRWAPGGGVDVSMAEVMVGEDAPTRCLLKTSAVGLGREAEGRSGTLVTERAGWVPRVGRYDRR
jgi:hypothetical protein